MKTLMLGLVMLMVIGLCAVSASADLLIDSFNYSSNADLQAVWNLNGSAPTMATIGGVPCVDIHEDNTGNSGYGGVSIWKAGSWNLTGCTGFTLSMAATNPSAIFYAFLDAYTDNNTSYYSIADYNYQMSNVPNTLTGQLQTGFCPLSWGGPGGTPNWANVDMIVYGVYLYGNAGPGEVYMTNLVANGVAVPEPGSLLALGFGLLGTAGLVIRRRS